MEEMITCALAKWQAEADRLLADGQVEDYALYCMVRFGVLCVWLEDLCRLNTECRELIRDMSLLMEQQCERSNTTTP